MTVDELSQYTYEDYIKDSELDYLGFDGVPDKPDSNLFIEQIVENNCSFCTACNAEKYGRIESAQSRYRKKD